MKAKASKSKAETMTAQQIIDQINASLTETKAKELSKTQLKELGNAAKAEFNAVQALEKTTNLSKFNHWSTIGNIITQTKLKGDKKGEPIDVWSQEYLGIPGTAAIKYRRIFSNHKKIEPYVEKIQGGFDYDKVATFGSRIAKHPKAVDKAFDDGFDNLNDVLHQSNPQSKTGDDGEPKERTDNRLLSFVKSENWAGNFAKALVAYQECEVEADKAEMMEAFKLFAQELGLAVLTPAEKQEALVEA